MKLDVIDKKIINFSYPVQRSVGCIKRKAILHKLRLKEKELDDSIKKLILYDYVKESHKNPSHDGLVYELTEEGLKLWNDTNKSILEKIKQHEKQILKLLLLPLIFFLLDLYGEEIKSFIISFFN